LTAAGKSSSRRILEKPRSLAPLPHQGGRRWGGGRGKGEGADRGAGLSVWDHHPSSPIASCKRRWMGGPSW